MDTALIVRPEPAQADLALFITDDVEAFAFASQSASTRRAYSLTARLFRSWCRAHGVPALPAAPETVCAWITERARTVKPATIAIDLAGLRDMHRKGGHDSPTEHEAVRAVYSGICRTCGTAQRRAAPMTSEVLGVVLSRIGTATLRDLRDRALLLIGMAAALRRSELVALDVEDLTFGPKGLDVLVRRSKTDQEGRGVVVAIPNGWHLKPVAALRAWLEAAGITSGPVFRPCGRGDRVLDGRLTDRSASAIVKARCEAAGFDPVTFSGHSLRSGFVTSAVERGAQLTRIQAVTRHKSIDVLAGYARHADRYEDHAAEGFL